MAIGLVGVFCGGCVMVKESRFYRIFSWVIVLAMVVPMFVSAFRPLPVYAESFRPGEHGPINPLERYGLAEGSGYDPLAVFDDTVGLTDGSGRVADNSGVLDSTDLYNNAYTPPATTFPVHDNWTKLGDWLLGRNQPSDLAELTLVEPSSSGEVYHLAGYLPSRPGFVVDDIEIEEREGIDEATPSVEIVVSAPDTPNLDVSADNVELLGECTPYPVGEGTGVPLAVTAAFLSTYEAQGLDCPTSDTHYWTTTALVWTQDFPGAAIIYNEVSGQAFYIPQPFIGVLADGAIVPDGPGGWIGLPVSGVDPAGPINEFQDANHNFVGQPIVYFENGFIGQNSLNGNSAEAHRPFPVVNDVQVTITPVQIGSGNRFDDYEAEVDFAFTFDLFGGVDGSVAIQGTAAGLPWGAGGRAGSTTSWDTSVGSTISLGERVDFSMSVTRVMDGSRFADDALIGYAPCDHFLTESIYEFDIPMITDTVTTIPFLYTCEGYNGTPPPADETPPNIEIFQLYGTKIEGSDELSVSLLARITDDRSVDNSTVNVVSSIGTIITPLALEPDSWHGANVYAATFEGIPPNTDVTFTVTASDLSENDAEASRTGYFVDGQTLGSSSCLSPCSLDGYVFKDGNPVSTVTGAKTETFPLMYVLGAGGADISIATNYNSNSVRLGMFGAAMSSDLETELVLLYNPLVEGVEIAIGDGGRFRFIDNRDGTFTAVSQGNDDALVNDGDGYLYTTHDQRSYRFDAEGRLVEKLDRNGNALSYTYADDQLTSITSGDRTVVLTYNGDGYVETLSIADKVITLTYEGDKLVGITDANGGTWQLEYETREIGEIIDERGEEFAYVASNHLLTRVVTPEGLVKNEQTYDKDLRVVSQTSSAKGELTFDYIENGDGSSETHITDAYGATEIHYYNALGQLEWKENREGFRELYEYDDNFHVIKKTDFNGNEWEYERDDNGNIVEMYGPEGLHESWEYNEFNRPTYFRDGDDFEWMWEYDGNGNLRHAIRPDGSENEIVYDSRGLPIELHDYNGNVVYNTYDPVNGDLISVADGEGSLFSYSYDAYGRRVGMTLPLGNVWTYAYDLNDNLTDVFGPLTYHETFTYDADDRLVSEEDADGAVTQYRYDERGRLVETQNGVLESTFFTYGEMNELASVTNARDAVTTYNHDANYRVVQVNMPEGVMMQYVYDGLGNMVVQIDGEGRLTVREYDGLSRMTSEIRNFVDGVPANADTNVETGFDYDYRDNLTRIINPLNNELEFAYDELGRLIQSENEENEATDYEYDENGNLILTRYPEENTVRTEYNGRNQPQYVWDGEAFRTELVYDGNGNLQAVIAPDGLEMRYEYNELDQQVLRTENYDLGFGLSSDINVTTAFNYSLAGDLEEVVDGEDYVFTYEYDLAHRLVGETNPEGTIEYAYDDVGNLIRRTDGNGHEWDYEYDLLDRLTTTFNPEDHRFDYEYDLVSNLVAVTDARRNTTTTEFDGLNRPISILNPLNYQTLFDYDAVGNLLALTDGNGHVTDYAYDRAQRMLERVDAEGYRTEYDYDDNGRLVLQRIPFADASQTVEEQFGYDGRDLRIAYTNGEGEVTAYAYNSVGLLETMTENDTVVTLYGYDGLRRLNGVTLNYAPTEDPLDDWNVAYVYGYDRVGNLVSTIDPLGRETVFDYNGLGSLEYERNPINDEWFYDYDPVQNLTYRRDGNEAETFYTYFDDDQLQLIDYENDADVVYTYDPNNNAETMQDGLGVTAWQYDGLNRVTDVRDSLGREVGYTYDALNRESVTYPDGRLVSYAYLDNDWMETVTDGVAQVSTYAYDEAGRMVGVDHPNNTFSTRSYDRAHRLVTLENYQDGGDVLSAFSYLYDPVGQRTQATQTFGWRNPETVVEDYSYDGIRRLVGVTDSEEVVTTYGYDRASNRTLWETNDDPFGQSPQDGFTATYAYNEANQLLTADIERTPAAQSELVLYSYDGNGNRIDRLVEGNGADEGMAYTYDDENRLVVGQSYLRTGGGNINWRDITTMAYDGLGRRLVETYDTNAGGGGAKTTEYTFDGLDPIAEYDLWNRQQRNYYRGSGNELVMMHKLRPGTQGQQYWYHFNGLGSVAGLTKQNGQSTHNYRYDAFGGVIPANGNWTQPHNEYTLTGKAWDDHTETFYFGARFYDPLSANWLTQDVYRGELQQPITVLRYIYVLNNPINYYDYYGYLSLDSIKDSLSNTRDNSVAYVEDLEAKLALEGAQDVAQIMNRDLTARFLGNYLDGDGDLTLSESEIMLIINNERFKSDSSNPTIAGLINKNGIGSINKTSSEIAHTFRNNPDGDLWSAFNDLRFKVRLEGCIIEEGEQLVFDGRITWEFSEYWGFSDPNTDNRMPFQFWDWLPDRYQFFEEGRFRRLEEREWTHPFNISGSLTQQSIVNVNADVIDLQFVVNEQQNNSSYR